MLTVVCCFIYFVRLLFLFFFFFFNDPATTEIYPLPLHDALPIWARAVMSTKPPAPAVTCGLKPSFDTLTEPCRSKLRSEEHTSELQSQSNLVCRLLLEKKKKRKNLCTTSVATHTDPCDIAISLSH